MKNHNQLQFSATSEIFFNVFLTFIGIKNGHDSKEHEYLEINENGLPVKLSKASNNMLQRYISIYKMKIM